MSLYLIKLRYTKKIATLFYLKKIFNKIYHCKLLQRDYKTMSVNTFNEMIKHSQSLTPDEQLRLATILIENLSKKPITIQPPVWEKLHHLVSALFPKKKAEYTTDREANTQAQNRWRAFFENTALPTEDFMQERVDFPPQRRELFKVIHAIL
jgi:hypothetical protein